MSTESIARSPIGEELLVKLRETILHQFPVNSESLAVNYEKLHQDVLKPQQFGCQTLDLFVYRVQLEHGIWETKFRNRQLIIKPSKVSLFVVSL